MSDLALCVRVHATMMVKSIRVVELLARLRAPPKIDSSKLPVCGSDLSRRAVAFERGSEANGEAQQDQRHTVGIVNLRVSYHFFRLGSGAHSFGVTCVCLRGCHL